MGQSTANLNLYTTDMQTDGDDYFEFDRDLDENWAKIDKRFGCVDITLTPNNWQGENAPYSQTVTVEGMTLEERAANVESQWSSFAGCQTFKQIETILRKKGYPVKIIENIPQKYNTYGARLIGNGFIITQEGKDDPIKISNGKHTFIVQSESFYNEADFLKLLKPWQKISPDTTRLILSRGI